MAWYRDHGRHSLPWRLTRDPYAVLVSEIMLQQTQVDRVVPYYLRWLERWPTVEALARANPAELLREWGGLGYNRRALNLHRMAVTVCESSGARIPDDVTLLKALPGVGPYTAAAVASFAFGNTVAVADTNISRLVARLRLGVPGQKQAAPRELAASIAALLPASGARDHNLALMDLGAMVCTARRPQCDACPLARACAWRMAGFPPGATAAAPPPRERFEQTARFARGRIVDALRVRPQLEDAQLRNLLPGRHAERLDEYLAGLEHDGLIERSADAPRAWTLPSAHRDHGRSSIASPKL